LHNIQQQMKLFQRIASNIILFIQVLLVFLLFFQNRITLPPWLQTVGRMHPLVLHLPIGLLVMSFLLWATRKKIDPNSFHTIFLFSLQLTALAASLTALMGFFLSREGGYEESTLFVHKTSGVLLSFLCCGLLILYQYFPAKKLLLNVSMIAAAITMLVAGDFGAILTHGEGFVWQPIKGEEKEAADKITDSSSLFTAAIRPILKAKCFSCHNEKKAKGELVMTLPEKLLAGGKNGPIWVAGDPLNSHIIQNINLPLEEKKHMPPKGKAQLTPDETELIYAWIDAGADMEKTLKDYPETDSLRILAAGFINIPEQPEEQEEEYAFSPASATAIQKLNNPFLSVFSQSVNSPALQADFFVRQNFDRKNLNELLSVKEQLVALNLSNMPVTDADMKIISKFNNLEKLILNNTGITSKALEELQNLKKLRSLSVAGTQVDKDADEYFAGFASLKEVFTWNSGISQTDAAKMQEKNKNIIFNTGYVADKNEILKLNKPVLKNENFVLSREEKIILSHYLPGAEIRFTIDGTVPDSTSAAIYKSPVDINGFTVLKTRATKSGWYSSDVDEYYFFEKGNIPQKAELIYPADKKYSGRGATSLIDGKKGTVENFKDTAWLGFREQPFAARFYFDKPPEINSITISYGKNVSGYILPPAILEIWGGDVDGKFILLKKSIPPEVKKEELKSNRMEGIKIDIPGSRYKSYKIIAKNIMKLPQWHPGKGEKGWVFIDEIFFN